MRGNVINHGRPLIRLLPQLSNDHVWISDSFVADAFARFSNRVLTQQNRHGSNVPGPLEARRRGTKRRNTHLAYGHGAQSSGFLATLFGSPKQTATTRYEPPSLTASKGPELPFISIPAKDQSPEPPQPIDFDFAALDISSNDQEQERSDIHSRPSRNETDILADDLVSMTPEVSPSVSRNAQEQVDVWAINPEIEILDKKDISVTQEASEVSTSTVSTEFRSSDSRELDNVSLEDYALKTGNWAVTYQRQFESPFFTDMKLYLEDISRSKYDSDHVQRMIARFKLRGPGETALLLAEYLCSRNQIQQYVRRAAEASTKISLKHGVDEMHELSCLMWVILSYNPYPINGAWKSILVTIHQAWGADALLRFVQSIRKYRPFPTILFHEQHSFIVDMLQQETLKACADPAPESAVLLCDLVKAFMFPHVFTNGLNVLPFRLIQDGKVGALEVMELVERQSTNKHLIWELAGSRARVSGDRVDYINRLAHAFSVAPNYTCAQAYRGVRRCYYFLKHRSAPITPDFTRALVRAGITRPLMAGRWVPNVKLLFILRIVEQVEGSNTAYSLEKLAYDWREKLIKEAVEIYRRVGLSGEPKVNTATDLVCYQRRLEEQHDEDGESDCSKIETLRLRREEVSVGPKQRARDSLDYKDEPLQPGRVFDSA